MSGKHDKAEEDGSAKLLLTGPIVIRGLGRTVKDAFRPGRPSRHRAFVDADAASPDSQTGPGPLVSPGPATASASTETDSLSQTAGDDEWEPPVDDEQERGSAPPDDDVPEGSAPVEEQTSVEDGGSQDAPETDVGRTDHNDEADPGDESGAGRDDAPSTEGLGPGTFSSESESESESQDATTDEDLPVAGFAEAGPSLDQAGEGPPDPGNDAPTTTDAVFVEPLHATDGAEPPVEQSGAVVDGTEDAHREDASEEGEVPQSSDVEGGLPAADDVPGGDADVRRERDAEPPAAEAVFIEPASAAAGSEPPAEESGSAPDRTDDPRPGAGSEVEGDDVAPSAEVGDGAHAALEEELGEPTTGLEPAPSDATVEAPEHVDDLDADDDDDSPIDADALPGPADGDPAPEAVFVEPEPEPADGGTEPSADEGGSAVDDTEDSRPGDGAALDVDGLPSAEVADEAPAAPEEESGGLSDGIVPASSDVSVEGRDSVDDPATENDRGPVDALDVALADERSVAVSDPTASDAVEEDSSLDLGDPANGGDEIPATEDPQPAEADPAAGAVENQDGSPVEVPLRGRGGSARSRTAALGRRRPRGRRAGA